MKFALQLYTVREHCRTGEELLSTLKAVRSAGYDGVEFAGTCGLQAENLKAALCELGLTAVAAHQGPEDLENRLEELLTYHRTLGSRALVCAYAPTGTRDEREQLERLLIRAKQSAAEYGLDVMYHNHSHEFEMGPDGSCPLDEIGQCCPLELDTYWAFHSGRDVSEYMRENADRIGLLHLKDGDTLGTPCAIGEGCNDIQGILDAAKELNMEWIIVENDDPVPDGLSDMARSIKNLKERYSL